MRDLLFAAAVLVLVPLAFLRPFNAYMLWGWTSALIPAGFLFGFMLSARVNFVFAGLAVLLVLLQRVDWREYRFNRVVALYVIFLVHTTIAWATAYGGNPDNPKYFELLVKSLFFCLLMPMFIQTRWQMHAMLVAIVLGLGAHGVIEGLKTVVSGGAHNMFGPRGSMLYDRNHLSTALAMILPIVYYLHLNSANRLVRLGFLGMFVLIVLAIMGGGSRGGFLALAVVGFWLVLTSRHRWRTLILVMGLGLLMLQFVPDSVVARLETIRQAGEDDSFIGRVHAWKVSSAIALQHPLFGGGFHAVQVQQVWDNFLNAPSLLDVFNLPPPDFYRAKAAHSIYFEVMGDIGFLGLAIYLTIFGQAILSRFAIKRMVNQVGAELVWARDLADMLMLAVLAYLVGGAGVSLGYLEVAYVVVMLMGVLHVHVRTKLNSQQRSARLSPPSQATAFVEKA